MLVVGAGAVGMLSSGGVATDVPFVSFCSAVGREASDFEGFFAEVDRGEPTALLVELARAAFFVAIVSFFSGAFFPGIAFFAAGALLAAEAAFKGTEALVFDPADVFFLGSAFEVLERLAFSAADFVKAGTTFLAADFCFAQRLR